MVLVLLGICLVCSAAVAMVYEVTKAPIVKSQQQKEMAALAAVLPEFDNSPEGEIVADQVVYRATRGGELVGVAVKSTSPNGFNGNIVLMVGFTMDGTIVNVEVVEQAETPGLGSNMASEDNVLLGSFKGRKAADMTMTVTKDGGDVDALTAATISSRAYAEAVALAYEAFKQTMAEEEQSDGVAAEDVLPAFDGELIVRAQGVSEARNAAGEVVGWAVEGSSRRGYNGTIRLLVGFDSEGTITGIGVLEQNETPSLGGKIVAADNVIAKSIVGHRLEELNLTPRAEGGDVDAITSATITTRAYVEAVESAYELLKSIDL